MNYKITKRRITDGLEDTINELHAPCFGDREYGPIEGSHWWLAEDPEGAAVGFAGLTVSLREGGAYLCRAGVLKDHRGHGLQRRLIKVREKFARQCDLNFMVTDTVEGNYHSANNLIEEGFRLYDPLTPWGSVGSLYWRKELA